jgi:A/G-specific DNA-adenine glycosylase (EC 3.2.2.-)
MQTLPGIPALAAAPQQQVLKLWEGLGYYGRA